MRGAHYTFYAELWMYPGEGAWHFITIPKEFAAELKVIADINQRGFGSIKVIAKIGNSIWNTSIFPDRKSGSYLLPIKKAVRTASKLAPGDMVKISLKIIDT